MKFLFLMLFSLIAWTSYATTETRENLCTTLSDTKSDKQGNTVAEFSTVVKGTSSQQTIKIPYSAMGNEVIKITGIANLEKINQILNANGDSRFTGEVIPISGHSFGLIALVFSKVKGWNTQPNITYNEFNLMIVARNAKNERVLVNAKTEIDNIFARDAGRQMWGFPKQLSDNKFTFQSSQNGGVEIHLPDRETGQSMIKISCTDCQMHLPNFVNSCLTKESQPQEPGPLCNLNNTNNSDLKIATLGYDWQNKDGEPLCVGTSSWTTGDSSQTVPIDGTKNTFTFNEEAGLGRWLSEVGFKASKIENSQNFILGNLPEVQQ